MFIADRIYEEWFFDKMEPMKHYIPVRGDFSDLREKYDYLESHTDLYNRIKQNMSVFSEKYLSPSAIINYAKEIILKYGTT